MAGLYPRQSGSFIDKNSTKQRQFTQPPEDETAPYPLLDEKCPYVSMQYIANKVAEANGFLAHLEVLRRTEPASLILQVRFNGQFPSLALEEIQAGNRLLEIAEHQATKAPVDPSKPPLFTAKHASRPIVSPVIYRRFDGTKPESLKSCLARVNAALGYGGQDIAPIRARAI